MEPATLLVNNKLHLEKFFEGDKLWKLKMNFSWNLYSRPKAIAVALGLLFVGTLLAGANQAAAAEQNVYAYNGIYPSTNIPTGQTVNFYATVKNLATEDASVLSLNIFMQTYASVGGQNVSISTEIPSSEQIVSPNQEHTYSAPVVIDAPSGLYNLSIYFSIQYRAATDDYYALTGANVTLYHPQEEGISPIQFLLFTVVVIFIAVAVIVRKRVATFIRRRRI